MGRRWSIIPATLLALGLALGCGNDRKTRDAVTDECSQEWEREEECRSDDACKFECRCQGGIVNLFGCINEICGDPNVLCQQACDDQDLVFMGQWCRE